MKLFFFLESVFPDNNAVSIRSHYLIKAFQASLPYFELVVLTGTTSPTPIDGVKFVSLSNPKSHNKGFLKRTLKELKLGFDAVLALSRFKEDVDFIYISSPSYLASLVLATYYVLRKRRFVFEVRDIYPQAFAYAGVIKEKGVIYKFFSYLSNLAYKRAELNISATEGIGQIIEQNVPDSKNLISFNGFPASFLSVNSEKFECFTLVFHGTLGLFQDVELLCDLARQLEDYNDIDLVVIGHGPKSELVERVSKSNQNIRFLGSLNHKETIDVVSKCHVGLSFRLDDPLSFISFPVKNWEYIGLAIPSIITPFGSEAGRFLEKNTCGIQIKERDVKAIMNVVLKLKSDKDYYQSYVDNCLHIRKSYTREAISDSLVKTLVKELNIG
jgi:glycosyltransferase involved in cell wall biosynthesis